MKSLFKSIARGLAFLLVLPLLASFHVGAWITGADKSLESTSQWLSLLPGLTGCYLRSAFYCRVLQVCHPTARIEFGTLFSKVGTSIGPHAYIGPRCHIGLAEIGRDTLIAAGVHIPSGAHIHGTTDLDTPIRNQAGRIVKVSIGNNCWIGSGAIIMADVGENSLVGAGSVVTKPIPELVLAAGVPAKVIRSRNVGENGEPAEADSPATSDSDLLFAST